MGGESASATALSMSLRAKTSKRRMYSAMLVERAGFEADMRSSAYHKPMQISR